MILMSKNTNVTITMYISYQNIQLSIVAPDDLTLLTPIRRDRVI